MARRIFLAAVWHETNGFSPIPTGLDAFRRYQWVQGPELLAHYRCTNTELGGAIAAAEARGVELVPAFSAWAVPAGLVTREAFATLRSMLAEAAAAAGPLDGALLVLHGAMAAEGEPEADAVLLETLQGALPTGLPLAATFDNHANLGPRMAAAADYLVGYDTFPHVDMGERGGEALRLLAGLAGGAQHPARVLLQLPMLTVPQTQPTGEAPMKAIMERVHALEAEAGIVCASAALGFAYVDGEHAGMALLGHAVPEAADRLEAGLEGIARELWAVREVFRPGLIPVEEAVARAVAAPRGPVVLVEPADNVGGGAPGDGTALLAALLAADADAAIVMWDPAAAARARAAGPGSHFAGPVGGSAPDLHGPAVHVEGTVTFAGNLAYARSGPYMTGQRVELGPSAVVRAGRLDILLTSERCMPFDRDHLDVAGIRPEEKKMLVAKSGGAWRAAFAAIAAEALYVDTPGVCSSNLARLRFEGAARDRWPLGGGDTLSLRRTRLPPRA
ncbi:M81 family metallopeptidase [Geminicoccaceae bacterium 1502E]|nr:M81 family metallopeptidase [Geminicoccaceae bacterium 1502E]